MIRSLLAGSLLLFALSPTAAVAAEWQVGADATLGFKGSYQGEGFAGRFEKFTATIVFDGAALDQATFEVSIDLASARTGNADYDSTMQEVEFFDSKRFPSARFVTKGFRQTGDRSYEADAELTLRDQTRPLVFPFQFVRDGDSAKLTATMVLKRLDFQVGTGDWTDTELLANEVEVRVELPLSLVKPAP